MARRTPDGAPVVGERARILVSGMVAGIPGQGGASWAVMQYLAGLTALGHDVTFVEPVEQMAGSRLGEAIRYTAECAAQVGLGDRWALATPDGLAGPLAAAADDDRFDLLINVAGMLRDPRWLERSDRRAYLDLDPLFTQLWSERDGVDMGFGGHTHFVTLTDRAGADGSVIPDCGLTWIPTVPLVALDHWSTPGPPTADAPITTVAHWRSYGPIHHDGRRFGQKAHSFRSIIDLPRRLAGPDRVAPQLRLALGIHDDETDDLRALHDHGWTVVDPSTVVATPGDYRRFVQSSAAELGVAKEGYVVSDSGWFSDRSACYLATGRPALAQRTGFERRIPSGEGVLAWSTTDELADCVDRLLAAPDVHRAAAHAVAREHLDAATVLARLLEHLLV